MTNKKHKPNSKKPWYHNGNRIHWSTSGYGYRPMGKGDVMSDYCPHCGAKDTLFHDNHWIYCENCFAQMGWNLEKVINDKGILIAYRTEGRLGFSKSHRIMNEMPSTESDKILKKIEEKYKPQIRRSIKIWKTMGRWEHVEV